MNFRHLFVFISLSEEKNH